MKSTNTFRAVLLAASFCGGAGSAFAGTIITTNLPSGAAIINVAGTADGAANYSGSNADAWYQPFNTSNNLLQYTFQPGTYTFRIVDQADAASMFPSLTPSQLSQIGGAWTYNSPWATDYLAFDISAVANASQKQLFTGAVTDNGFGYGSPSQAYQRAITFGYYNQIVTGTGRYSGTTVSSYTFAIPQTLVFAVPDYYLPDNGGIVSVLVTTEQDSLAVPEPSTFVLAALGLLGLGCLALRKKYRRA